MACKDMSETLDNLPTESLAFLIFVLPFTFCSMTSVTLTSKNTEAFAVTNETTQVEKQKTSDEVGALSWNDETNEKFVELKQQHPYFYDVVER